MNSNELWFAIILYNITLLPSTCRSLNKRCTVTGGCVDGEWNVSANNLLFVACQMQSDTGTSY